MLIKSYQMAFFTTLVTGTVVACSANSWFTCWLGLEINLMSLIPLLIIKLTPLSTETAIKYFMAQAMASLIIIFASLTEASLSFMNMMNTQNEIILMALCIKAGMAPFHFWFPQVMKMAEWAQCAMILTWQKIAPFVLISSLTSSLLVYAVVTLSAMVGMLGGLNQMMIKLMLTYSSIAHSAWMMAICYSSSIMSWASYFMVYSVISIGLILILYKTNTNSINETMMSKWHKTTKIMFMVSVMSLGGLPPFLGFVAKLNAIQLIIKMMSLVMTSILITSSLVSLYYYTRMMYSMLMKTSKMNLIYQDRKHTFPALGVTISVAGNVLAPILVMLT